MVDVDVQAAMEITTNLQLEGMPDKDKAQVGARFAEAFARLSNVMEHEMKELIEVKEWLPGGGDQPWLPRARHRAHIQVAPILLCHCSALKNSIS